LPEHCLRVLTGNLIVVHNDRPEICGKTDAVLQLHRREDVFSVTVTVKTEPTPFSLSTSIRRSSSPQNSW
jgi:ABC-type hemin transport system ATPase subunit